MKPIIAAAALTALWSLAGAGVASADPGSGCGFHDPRLCDPGRMYWCPDSQQWVTWMQPCSNYVVGPYAPGVPSNGGNGRDAG